MWYLKLHKHLKYIIVSSNTTLTSKKNFVILDKSYENKEDAMNAAVKYIKGE